MSSDSKDFTYENYKRLLGIAKQNYRFIRAVDYRDFINGDNVIINRHDVDYSIHRAAKISAIEKEEDVASTYFIYLHSRFYNVFEADVTRLLKDIVCNGHEIGLHFDPSFYEIQKDENEKLEFYLNYERYIVETLLDVEIKAFSLHTPEVGDWLNLGKENVSGLINMYSDFIKVNYKYCSDSDGYWRYDRLEDVLIGAEHKRLHILTHPEWWVSEIMKPRDRILRCASGRLESSMRYYDELMSIMGRKNEK